MCGIIGMAGLREFSRAYRGLQSLEYRGYDSFGFGAVTADGLMRMRKVGAISDADPTAFADFDDRTTVIGHTRWATHGGVSEKNSHPHLSDGARVMIVHNGVIANFADLKATGGWSLQTDTDTEIGANVIADHLGATNDLIEALQRSVPDLGGEFAICGVIDGRTDTLFAIKRKSPLIVAKHAGGLVVASDRTALAKFGESIELAYLEDDTVFAYENGQMRVATLNMGRWDTVELEFIEEDLRSAAAELGNYPHFMLKEINECPDAVRAMRAELETMPDGLIERLTRSTLSISGSGSSYFVSMIGQYFFRALAGIYVPVHPSDEFLGLKPLGAEDTVLLISQSGETFDTLEVLRHAQEAGAKTMAMNNVAASTMQRLADFAVLQNSGKEVCVLSTKSIVSQATGLYLLAAELGRHSGYLDAASYDRAVAAIDALPDLLQGVIDDGSADIRRIAYKISTIEHWFFIGRAAHYPVALENALKFKEVSYLHAEGIPAGFLKHGTISLIDDDFYTTVFLPSASANPELFQLTIDNVHEIRARGGKVIGVGSDLPDSVDRGMFHEFIAAPSADAELDTIVQLVVGQLFAYYCAVSLGRNIDRPRALAKSVTVR